MARITAVWPYSARPPSSSSLGDSRPAVLGHPVGMSAVVVDVRDVTFDPGDLGTERGIE